MRLRGLVSTSILLALPLSFALAGCDSGSNSDEGGNDNAECYEEWVDKEGGVESLMDAYGAPCETAADCVPLLGDTAFCQFDPILETVLLPNGYCTKPCDVPEGETFLADSEQCQPGGGIDCLGTQGIFTACAPPCDDDSQCTREGYGCTQMPLISFPDDPRYCLSNPVACCIDEAAC